MELTEAMQDFATEKLRTLERFTGDETDIQCSVEFEKVTPRQNGRIHRVEANLWLRGNLYRAEASEETYQLAIEEVRNELQKELRRAQGKRMSLIKRGGRKLKEMLRFGR